MSTSQTATRGITVALNAGLFLYVIYSATISLLLEPRAESQSYWNELFAGQPMLEIAALLIAIMVSVGLGAFFITQVWNRLLIDV